MPISTRDLSALPDASALEKLCQSIAMLEAILSPEWQYRYFSFNAKWEESKQERMASMRNGSGDEYFLLFGRDGAFLKGFDHESPMSPWASEPTRVWPGVTDQVPADFASFLKEPAFDMDNVTFCIWRREKDSMWKRGSISFPEGDDPDGSQNLLWMFDGMPETYVRFVSEHYEKTISIDAVRRIYQKQPLTDSMILALNSEAQFETVKNDAEEIGYPVSREA